MKIKNLDKKIKDLDGNNISSIRIELDPLVTQIEKAGEGNILKTLKKLQEEKKEDLTYGKLYEESVFLIDSKKPNDFAEAVFIAQKVRDDGDFKVEEIKIIKDRIPLLNKSGLAKGLGIINLDDCEKEVKDKK